MQESLPETAPLGDEAVAPVGETAPSSDETVVTESARGVDQVPAARFNGLMGKFNQTQSALEAARQEIAELRASSQTHQEVPVTDASPSADTTALHEQVSQLTRLVMEERLETAKAKALKEFPEAEVFADLIVADTPAGIRDMAQILAERLRSRTAEGTTEATEPVVEGAPEVTGTETAPAAVTAPVIGGGTTVTDGGPAPAEKVATAISSRNFRDYLSAKREQLEGSELVLD